MLSCVLPERRSVCALIQCQSISRHTHGLLKFALNSGHCQMRALPNGVRPFAQSTAFAVCTVSDRPMSTR